MTNIFYLWADRFGKNASYTRFVPSYRYEIETELSTTFLSHFYHGIVIQDSAFPHNQFLKLDQILRAAESPRYKIRIVSVREEK